MVFNFIAAAFSAVKFIFTSQTLLAQGARFVAGTILSHLLSGGNKQEGPRLSDLRVQVSTYGNAIPRLYGQAVRISGNVIDKSDILETTHKKKSKMLGITIASQKFYTYSVDLAVLLGEGPLSQDGLRRIWAQGKVIFDRDADGAGAGIANNGGWRYRRQDNTHVVFDALTYYHGSDTQTVDDVLQTLHGADPVPAYRHSAYVVIERLELADWGNGVPNLEFEIETPYPGLADAVTHIASFADVTLDARTLAADVLRGYVIASAGNVWSAIEPLAGTFNFDLITKAGVIRTKKRGLYMRTLLALSDFAARPADGQAADVYQLTAEDPNTYPDEVTVTYMDTERDMQPGSQRAFRNEGFSKNKEDIELAIVLSPSEARQVAQRTLAESIASTRRTNVYVSERYRWLEASDIVGIPIGSVYYPFRILNLNRSPSGVITLDGVFDDPLSYTGTIPATSGDGFTRGVVRLPGDTIFQPMDAPILEDETDTGFYFGVTGTGLGFRGANIFRAEGVGSPLTYELILDPGVAATIGECVSTLANGPTFAFDYVNTLDVQVYAGVELDNASEADVLVLNANFAWVGDADGQEGEYINFTTATPSGSPNVWTIGGLLRGRRGTEHAAGSHGSGERFVLIESGLVGRVDFGPADWNVTNTYLPVSVYQESSEAAPIVFTNTGECRRPYAPVLLTGTRNGSNDDVLIGWTRRTRMRTAPFGAAPLGEDIEAYEVDIMDGADVVRTLTAGTTSVNYTTAQQTADGFTTGAPVSCRVYQVSGVRGRGHPLEGIV